MQFNNTTKTLLVIVAILAAVYLLFGQSSYLVSNMGNMQGGRVVEHMESDVDSDMEEQALPENSSEEEPRMIESDPLAEKFATRNQAKNGYKRSSYAGGDRGMTGPSDWDRYFDENNNVIGAGLEGSNDRFVPRNDDNGDFAAFATDGKIKSGQELDPEDLYDSNNYLPQEHRDDWYEVMPEPVSVKNRSLINVTRPIGVNTISTTKKNASYDIRGTPACPKYVISPFLNSSIEQDINLDPRRALM